MKQVHLVVPCYRESRRIGDFLPELCAHMQEMGGVKVLVVEDGSGLEEQDAMRRLMLPLQEQYPCLLPPLMLGQNIGKGGAVYAGWESETSAELLAFVDADGASPPREVARLISLARSDSYEGHALFASRVKMLGRQVRRLLKRHLLGRIYATLVSEIFNIPIYDSQCGLKIVPKIAFQKVAAALQIKGFAFDVELLVALRDTGCQIVEVPTDWYEIPGGKVRLIHDSILMAKDVWRIRSLRGRKWD